MKIEHKIIGIIYTEQRENESEQEAKERLTRTLSSAEKGVNQISDVCVQLEIVSKQKFYVHKSWARSVFVKTEEFFIEQGGLEKEWGKAWSLIKADSIEEARDIGKRTLKPWISEKQEIKE
jgi:hypothetical protein